MKLKVSDYQIKFLKLFMTNYLGNEIIGSTFALVLIVVV